MTRTIKFRGKRLDNGKWVYGSLLQELISGCTTESIIIDYGYGRDYEQIKVGTCGQFTGLTDKNNREIYEGDIIRTDVAGCNFADGACGTVTFIRVVSYDEERAGFYPFTDEHGMYAHYDWEIIGNFHDRTITYDGKQYEAVILPYKDGNDPCARCSRLIGNCGIGFYSDVCDVFESLQSEDSIVVLHEIKKGDAE